MRAIERTAQFKRDFKREMKGRHGPTLEAALTDVLHALVRDTPLEEKYRDHPLSGEWTGFRDRHVKPDLVLIYGKPDADTVLPPMTKRKSFQCHMIDEACADAPRLHLYRSLRLRGDSSRGERRGSRSLH